MGFHRITLRTFFSFAAILILGVAAQSSPELITFQSRIVKPTGQALESSSVNFRLSLTDSVGSCVIFQEDFIGRNMTGTKGLVTLTLGSGSKVFPAGPMTMPEVFNNFSSPSFNCQSGGSIVAGSADRRKLIMQFNDGSGWQTVPAVDINASPYAMQALAAQRLGNYPANDYLRTAQLPTCGGGQSLTFNGTSIVCAASGGGSGTVTNVTSANSYLSVATGTTTPTLTLNVGTGANTVAAGDDARITGAAQRSANLSDVANAATARTNLGLGTAATLNVGTGINNVVQLDGSSRLPAVDGSLLTGVVATNVADNSITSAKIVNGEILNADISSNAAIARSKIATGAAGHVVINDSSTGALSSLTCGVGAVLKFDVSGFAICGTDVSGTGDIMNGGNTGAVTIGTNDAQALNLETNGSPQLTISSNGNVGIGTTIPTSKLFVLDNSRRDPSLTYGDPAGTVLNNGGVELALGTQNSSPFEFWMQARNQFSAASPLAINPLGGNVGIGTTTPAEKLSVLGRILIDGGNSNKTANMSVDQSLSLFRIQQNDNGATTEFDLVANTYAALRFNGTERFKVTNAGNVGIGIPTPLRPLHVSGPIRINPSTVPGSPAAGDLYVDSADNNILKFYDGSSWISAGSGGGGGVTTVSSANSYLSVANGSSTPTLTVNVGTATNTLAAGDDSRITGAAQKSANLSDLANAGTARSNLGLGTAAVLNVGTGINNVVQLDGSSRLPAVDGSLLTGLTSGQIPNLDAAKITSGTLAGARLPALSGDVTMAAGTTTTAITDLARSKLAAGSNNHVLINNGSGVMTSEAQLAISRGGTGLSSYTNNALIMANGTGSALTNATCSIGEILMWNATTWACTNIAASSQGYFKDGGNSFSGTATIGTNSAHDLAFETSGTTKMTVLANGNVGIGTAGPTSKLGVADSTTITSGTYSSTNFALSTFPGATTTARTTAISATNSNSTNPAQNGGDIVGGSFSASTLSGTPTNVIGSSSVASSYSPGLGAQTLTASENTVNNMSPATTVHGSKNYVNHYGSTVTNGYGTKSDYAVIASGIVTGSAYGVSGNVVDNANSDMGGAYGGHFTVTMNKSAGATTNVYGILSDVEVTDGIATNAHGLYTEVTRTPGDATVNNAYGLRIGSVQGTTKYSIFASDATAPSHFAGNVGIGTTNPLATLDIGDNGGASPLLSAGYIFEVYQEGFRDKVRVGRGSATNMRPILEIFGGTDDSAGMVGAIDFRNDDSTNITSSIKSYSVNGTDSQGSLSLATHDGTSLVERLNITSTGQVGIGTGIPSSMLSVVGANATAGNATNVFSILGGNGAAGAGLVGGDGSAISLQTGNGGSDNIGGSGGAINFTSGNGGTGTVIIGGAGGAINFTAGNGGGGVGGGPGGSITLNPGAGGGGNGTPGNVILATTGGNVVIGGESPQAKLDVRGTASAQTITEGSSTYVNSGAAYTIPDSTLSVRRIDLTANTTLTLPTYSSSLTRVYTLTIFLRQDATGSRTVSWDGAGNTIKWDAGSAPTISATANKITIIQLTKVSDETVWYGSMVWRED